MSKSRSRKSNIQSIEVKVKQQPLQPIGSELSPNESPSQGVRELYPDWSEEEIEEYRVERLKELQEYLKWAREARALTQE